MSEESNPLEVHFFASLRERVGTARLSATADSLSEVHATLIQQLGTDRVAHLLAPNVRVAVNQQLIEGDWHSDLQPLPAGAEVAFLPPVTGG